MRLIDADALLEDEATGILEYFDGNCKFGYSRKQIEEAATIDAVEVVRCKDCKRWKDPRDYECPYHTSGDPHIDDDPEEDFFCKRGERREDDG